MSRKSTISNKKGFIPIESKSRTGFTIIEVVLVLAIAGLIFLIVFRALPGLQKNRRDTTRKSDFNSMVAQLETVAGNNGGKYPNDINSTNYPSGCISFGIFFCPVNVFLSGFAPTTGPDGAGYNVVTASGTDMAVVGSVNYVQGGYCDDKTPKSGSPGTGNAYGYAIAMKLESGAQCKSVPAQ